MATILLIVAVTGLVTWLFMVLQKSSLLGDFAQHPFSFNKIYKKLSISSSKSNEIESNIYSTINNRKIDTGIIISSISSSSSSTSSSSSSSSSFSEHSVSSTPKTATMETTIASSPSIIASSVLASEDWKLEIGSARENILPEQSTMFSKDREREIIGESKNDRSSRNRNRNSRRRLNERDVDPHDSGLGQNDADGIRIRPRDYSPAKRQRFEGMVATTTYKQQIQDYVNAKRNMSLYNIESLYSEFKYSQEISEGREQKTMNSRLNRSFVEELKFDNNRIPFYEFIDLIFIVPDKFDMNKLIDNWERELRSFHLIMLCEEDVSTYPINIPEWLDYEMHTVEGMRNVMGKFAWIIGDKFGGLGNGIALIPFAGWISAKDHMLVLDQYSKPVNSTYSPLNFVEEHFYNMLSPSAMHYFNSHGDPYQPGSDFVRGVPFFLRKGQVTAVSQGLSINELHMDTVAKQTSRQYSADSGRRGLILTDKIQERTTTIPSGTLYSMNLNNFFYNTKHIGPGFIIFNPNPKQVYDNSYNFAEYKSMSDVMAGWMMKLLADHMGVGVKVGPPYVERRMPEYVQLREHDQEIMYHNESSDWVKDVYNLLTNYEFMLNDSSIWTAFHRPIKQIGTWKNPYYCGRLNSDMEIHPKCFMNELHMYMDRILGPKYYFFKYYTFLATKYLDFWFLRKSFLSDVFPVAVKSSHYPHSPEHSTCAIMTISHNEKQLLPIWLRYYMRHVPAEDIYILDHLTTDGSTKKENLPPGVKIWTFHHRFTMPVIVRSEIVKKTQDILLRHGYKCVIFSDTDEFIVPNPTKYPGGLKEYLKAFIADKGKQYMRVKAYELGHMAYGNGTKESQEPPLDWSKSILGQRQYYVEDGAYNKPLLTKIPLVYRPGFHKVFNYRQNIPTDEDLVMFHIRSMDQDFCMKREEHKFQTGQQMDPIERSIGMASHWFKFEDNKKSGKLCRFAIAGSNTNKDGSSRYFDNLGTTEMFKLNDAWKSVEM